MRGDLLKQALRYRWLVYSILALGYLFVYFHRLSLSVVADTLVKEFNTSASVMGLLGSIYFYCYAAMQLPAGLLSDSIGPRKTVTLFLLIASAGSILFGLAPNLPVAFGGRVLVGFGVSMVFIPTMKILSQWFRKNEFAFMTGILNAVGGCGALAATWLLALMASAWGWRFSFELIGICTLGIVAGAWLLVRDKPQDKGYPSIIELDRQEQGESGGGQVIGLLEGLKIVFSEPRFWPLAIWFFLDCGIFFGFGALWAGPYLMHTHGMSRAESGAILSMIAWGMIIGSPLLGLVSDRLWKSRKRVMILCTFILTLEMLYFYLAPSGHSHAALYALIFVFSVCASSIVVIGFSTAKELFPVEIAGTSVGSVNLFPFLGGAVYMPMLGRALDAFPKGAGGAYALEAYESLFLILFITSALALVCTFFLKDTLRQ